MVTRVERSFRGISERLAIRYLRNLGAEQVADDAVAGDGWRARISSTTVDVGPSLTLTEVRVVFEGEGEGEDDLEDLVEDFAQKAMRAGG